MCSTCFRFCFTLLLLGIGNIAFAEETITKPVEAGKNGLEGESFKWYDAEKDDLRPLNVQPPRANNNNFNTNTGPTTNYSGQNMSLPGMEVILYLFLAIVIGVAVYLLILAYLRRENSKSTDNEEAEEALSPIDRLEELPLAVDRNVGDLLSAARQAFEQGNYGKAIIYLYSHQLVTLDRHQLIHLTKGKTNRQYLRELARSGRRRLPELLEKSLVTFEEVFFGHHPIERARLETCLNDWPEFERLLREGAV